MLAPGTSGPRELNLPIPRKEMDMRKRLIFAALVLALTATQAIGQVEWYKGTADEALAEAKEKQICVMIDFHTPWCGWCKRLDETTWADSSVGEALKDIICLSLNADKEGAALAEKYRVDGFPAILFLLPDGDEATRISGYVPPAEFKKRLAMIRSGIPELSKCLKALKTNPKDPEANLRLGVNMLNSDRDKAAEYFKKVIEFDSDGQAGLADDANFYLLKLSSDNIRNITMRIHLSARRAVQLGRIIRKSDKLDVPKPYGDKLDALRLAHNEYLESIRTAVIEAAKKGLPGLGEHVKGIIQALAEGYKAFADKNPKSNMANIALQEAGNLYQSIDMHEAALKLFEVLEKRKVENASLFNNHAWALFRLNKSPAKAEDLSEKAVKLAPKQAAYLDTLAEIKFSAGNADRAVELAEKAMQLDPRNPVYRSRLQKYRNAKRSASAAP